jgi:hypothetical protein
MFTSILFTKAHTYTCLDIFELQDKDVVEFIYLALYGITWFDIVLQTV